VITLDAVSIWLESVLAYAETTQALSFLACYTDMVPGQSYVFGCFTALSTGTTPVIILPPPSDPNCQRSVKHLSVYNWDTAAAQITLRINDQGAGLLFPIWPGTLQPGEMLTYTDVMGWSVADPSGMEKIVLAPAVTYNQLAPPANGTYTSGTWAGGGSYTGSPGGTWTGSGTWTVASGSGLVIAGTAFTFSVLNFSGSGTYTPSGGSQSNWSEAGETVAGSGTVAPFPSYALNGSFSMGGNPPIFTAGVTGWSWSGTLTT